MYLYIGHTESKSLSESPVPVLGTRFAARSQHKHMWTYKCHCGRRPTFVRPHTVYVSAQWDRVKQENSNVMESLYTFFFFFTLQCNYLPFHVCH